MIRQLLILLLSVAAATGILAPGGPAHARDLSVSFSGHFGDYYDDLDPYGTWVSVSYGWAWCPLEVSASWRPYTVGRWAYTDWGWTWISADPWGSTPYHYGRWAYDDYYGWIWVPGDVWAPAWVSWRYGGDWIGWAPLSPDFGWRTSIGFRYSSYEYDRRIPSSYWCYSRGSGFLDSRVRVEPVSRNVTLRNVTRNVTRYEVVGSMPAERGLRPEWVSRAAKRSVPRYRLVDSPGSQRDPAVRGNEIAVSRPRPAGRGSDRVRAIPPERYRRPPDRALIERQRAERGRVTQRMNQERRQLEQSQRQETRKPPTGVSPEVLQRRHDAEQRAQAAREEQARRTYERRQQRLERTERGAKQPSRNDVQERPTEPARQDRSNVQERRPEPARQDRGRVQERPARPAREDRGSVQERPARPAREDRGNVQERPARPAREERGNVQERRRTQPPREERGNVQERPAQPNQEDKVQEPPARQERQRQQPQNNERKRGGGRERRNGST